MNAPDRRELRPLLDACGDGSGRNPYDGEAMPKLVEAVRRLLDDKPDPEGPSVVRHWLAGADALETREHVVTSESYAEQLRADGWAVTGPYVLEASGVQS